ncbi:RsmD family RNA methyltransferase [Capnocytophaga sp. G2]|uniref:RsmD family RNA methyltransferase n=1 Tax=Capnocytophaga sp. G2 TaxID=3110695 RepID=UPI002B474338|nr:RsmD family RNA methyltransferase [Capnocytophaga sp. G2]MEB3004084.1 RsmD family RNA methyltransferase [Capnocytophaga sp. G2]
MRIISGSHRGKQLIAPRTLPVRPTTDFAKESLFNILNNYYYMDSIKVLDLFAGTGNISYEFGSRGCPDITCIDSHIGCIQYIQKTALALSYPIEAIKSDVFTYLERTLSKWDVIFADPPYEMSLEELTRLVSLVFDRALLSPDGILIIEHSAKVSMGEQPYFDQERRYGGTTFSFFEHSKS